jgi:hypothetical protein
MAVSRSAVTAASRRAGLRLRASVLQRSTMRPPFLRVPGRVLAPKRLRAKGRGSGVPVDTEYAHIMTFREGLCLRVDGFPTWRQALAAAGLGE